MSKPKSEAQLARLRKQEPITYAAKPITAGRPSKLSPEVQRSLIRALEAGNHKEVACSAAGIDHTTYLRWMRRGEAEPGSDYGRFRRAVLAADDAAEQDAVTHWRRHFPKDWRAAREFLAARNPSRWSQRIRVTVEEELDATLAKLERALPPDVYEQVLEAIATGESSPSPPASPSSEADASPATEASGAGDSGAGSAPAVADVDPFGVEETGEPVAPGAGSYEA